MLLKDYMRQSNLDDAAMAAAIGDCTSGAVKKWKYGERIPRPGPTERIRALTNGLVTAEDHNEAFRRRVARARDPQPQKAALPEPSDLFPSKQSGQAA